MIFFEADFEIQVQHASWEDYIRRNNIKRNPKVQQEAHDDVIVNNRFWTISHQKR
jgi:hypothetical protein